MNSIAAQPDRRPDLRAIVDGEGKLLVVPWHPGLAWSEFQAGPVRRHPIFGPPGPTAERPQAIFELWRDGATCFARQIGGDPAADRSGSLREWAERQVGALTLGDRLPDLAPDPTPLRLPYRRAARPPDFRFVFTPQRGGRLRITPWGFASLALDTLSEPWDGAVGDVIAIDRDSAVAYFARSTPGSRIAAERALLAWADKDGWELEIDPGSVPLIRPTPAPETHAPYRVCRDCGDRCATGWASHLRFGGTAGGTGFQPTRCRVCGGRYLWFEKRAGPQKLGPPPLP